MSEELTFHMAQLPSPHSEHRSHSPLHWSNILAGPWTGHQEQPTCGRVDLLVDDASSADLAFLESSLHINSNWITVLKPWLSSPRFCMQTVKRSIHLLHFPMLWHYSFNASILFVPPPQLDFAAVDHVDFVLQRLTRCETQMEDISDQSVYSKSDAEMHFCADPLDNSHQILG